jgi:hypothetical protein
MKHLWSKKEQLAEDAKLFERVGFLVEATHQEQHTFWHDYHHEPRAGVPRVLVWTQETRGHMVTLGWLEGRPICVTLFYATLDGTRVLFYEATSQLVDHAMVEQWLRHHTERTIRYDGGRRWARTDSSNFAHCLGEVQARYRAHSLKAVV